MEQKLDRIIQLLERIAHVEKPVSGSQTGVYVGQGGNAGKYTGTYSPLYCTNERILNGTGWKTWTNK